MIVYAYNTYENIIHFKFVKQNKLQQMYKQQISERNKWTSALIDRSAYLITHDIL